MNNDKIYNLGRVAILIVFLWNIALSASTVGNEDSDKGGSWVTGLFDAAETFSETADAVGTAAGAPAAVGEAVEKVDEVKEAVKDVGAIKGLQGTLTQIAVPYTHSKASVLTMVRNGLKKTNEIIGKVAKRVDMWRTTKPTIEKYYKAAGRLADDTKDLYKDFKWSKFFDYHRPWDKKREKMFDADVDFTHWRGAYVNYCNDLADYMTQLYKYANQKEDTSRKMALNTRRGHFIPNTWTEENLPKLVDKEGNLKNSLIPGYEEAMVPVNALELAALVMYTLDELQAEYKSIEDGDSVTREDRMIRKMMYVLNTGETPPDTKNLSEYIAKNRLKINDQMVRANQLRVQAQTYYANLFMQERHVVERAAQTVESSYGVLAMGREAYEKYVNTVRPDIKEASIKE